MLEVVCLFKRIRPSSISKHISNFPYTWMVFLTIYSKINGCLIIFNVVSFRKFSGLIRLLFATILIQHVLNFLKRWIYFIIRTPMPKCDFNKVAKQITLRHGCSPVNLQHVSVHLFIRTPLGGCFWFMNFQNCLFVVIPLYVVLLR